MNSKPEGAGARACWFVGATYGGTTKASVRYRGDHALYSDDGDYIQMPVIEAFRDAESFYETVARELTRWTKHK